MSLFSELAERDHQTIRLLRKQLADRDLLIEQLGEALDCISDLRNESDGVYGLHRNGDVAPWETLEDGGEFEGWMTGFYEALTAYREWKESFGQTREANDGHKG